MSNNNQQVELTDITSPLLAATQGLTMEDRDASIGLLLDFAERGRNRGLRLPSICKVPSILRDLNESSFNPQLVSIGPIHRENEKLKEFEWLKGCYLHDLLNRCYSNSTPKETILEACLQEVNNLIPKIRKSYACVIENCSDDELAGMMVMDGCFILEFCFKHEEADEYLPNKMQNIRIAMDLMLLENQVPFSVLQALFDCSMGNVHFTLSDVLDTYLAPYVKLFYPLPEKKSILSNILDKYLAPYIKLFRPPLHEKNSFTDVDSDLPEKISTTYVSDSTHHAHVLGYLHKRYQIVDAEQAAKSWNPVGDEALRGHTIVELDRSGMNFKPHQEDEWSMFIKFQSSSNKPILLMPTLVIHDTTELILRNFIAYEQSFLQECYYFTSYAHAMSKLIYNQEDVAKLVESKVLLNMFVSNQEAADMINNICKNMFVTDFYYAQQFKQMDKYYNRFWPKHIAWLRRVYFRNPWNFISLIAAIILFSLTVVQTIYTIRAK